MFYTNNFGDSILADCIHPSMKIRLSLQLSSQCAARRLGPSAVGRSRHPLANSSFHLSHSWPTFFEPAHTWPAPFFYRCAIAQCTRGSDGQERILRITFNNEEYVRSRCTVGWVQIALWRQAEKEGREERTQPFPKSSLSVCRRPPPRRRRSALSWTGGRLA